MRLVNNDSFVDAVFQKDPEDTDSYNALVNVLVDMLHDYFGFNSKQRRETLTAITTQIMSLRNVVQHYEEIKDGITLEPDSPPYAQGLTGPYPVRGRPPPAAGHEGSARDRPSSLPPSLTGMGPATFNRREVEVMSVASQAPSITAHLADDASVYEDRPALPSPSKPEAPLPAMPSPEAMATSISRLNLLEMGAKRHGSLERGATATTADANSRSKPDQRTNDSFAERLDRLEGSQSVATQAFETLSDQMDTLGHQLEEFTQGLEERIRRLDAQHSRIFARLTQLEKNNKHDPLVNRDPWAIQQPQQFQIHGQMGSPEFQPGNVAQQVHEAQRPYAEPSRQTAAPTCSSDLGTSPRCCPRSHASSQLSRSWV